MGCGVCEEFPLFCVADELAEEEEFVVEEWFADELFVEEVFDEGFDALSFAS